MEAQGTYMISNDIALLKVGAEHEQQNEPEQEQQFEELSSNIQVPNKHDKPIPQLIENVALVSLNKDPETVVDYDKFRSEATFSYTLDDFSQLKAIMFSKTYYVRTLPWKIMLVATEEGLGFFVQCNGEDQSPTWSCIAVAELRLICYKAGAQHYTRDRIKHQFHAKENDYGYANFISWRELLNINKGYLKNHSVTLEVHLTADAPHGGLWDSKKYTGYVGLKNQGATCYMNSLLQTLYFTNELRHIVYRMPVDNSEEPHKSVGLSLKRIFYGLQKSVRPVGTNNLTRSFGWDRVDLYIQRDVQEFLRILMDYLESKMKGTCLDGTIPALFEGTMASYIKCINVDYSSTRFETYYDIQLNIKNKKNIFESFEDYIASETLHGENKYDAGIHGVQEASKGVIFIKFPPVLHLHLMRYEYDPITDILVKNNERFEFFERINLSPYLAEKETPAADYVLHAVLVHSGDNNGGHYVVFINPKADGVWFKFDDDVVSHCSKNEAIEQNYGGTFEDIYDCPVNNSNAYMLVYIRQSELSQVLREIRAPAIHSKYFGSP